MQAARMAAGRFFSVKDDDPKRAVPIEGWSVLDFEPVGGFKDVWGDDA